MPLCESCLFHAGSEGFYFGKQAVSASSGYPPGQTFLQGDPCLPSWHLYIDFAVQTLNLNLINLTSIFQHHHIPETKPKALASITQAFISGSMGALSLL